MTIRPLPGKLVRDPANGYTKIPEKEKTVRNSIYWNRRLKSGDVGIVLNGQTKDGE
jgi:hypothetical protein